MKKEILKPVELPLSLDKTYRLFYVDGCEDKQHNSGEEIISERLTKDFKLVLVTSEGCGYVDGNLCINLLHEDGTYYLREVEYIDLLTSEEVQAFRDVDNASPTIDDLKLLTERLQDVSLEVVVSNNKPYRVWHFDSEYLAESYGQLKQIIDALKLLQTYEGK